MVDREEPEDDLRRSVNDFGQLELHPLSPGQPPWFVWDGDGILVFSKPHAQKVRNLRSSPRVMMAIGEPGADWDVELVEGVAELLPVSAGGSVLESFAAKYRELMSRAGTTREQFARTYSQPIRIRPTRWLNYGGAGWREERAAA